MYFKKSACLKSSCVFLISLLSLLNASAANFTSALSGDWDKGATWGNGSLNIIGVTYPGPLDNATITSGKNVQVKQSQSVTNITVNTGGVLTNSNNKDLLVFGNYVLNGVHTGGNGSTITFFGLSKSISGIGTMDVPGGAFLNFSITILATANLNVASTLNLSAGVTVTNNGKITMVAPAVITATASGPAWVNAANSFLSPGASTDVLNNVTLDASATGNTVNYYQTPVQNIKIPVSSTYYNLIISGVGTKSMTGNLTVLGDITISATTLNTATYTMSVKGNWSNEGALSGTGTVVFNGTTDQTISNSSGEIFYNMTTSKSSGYLILNNNATVSNTFTMTNGQINANLQVLTIGTSTSVVGSLVYSGGFIFNGFVSRWVNATGVAVLFPMGIQYGSYYAPLTITFNNLTAGALMVRFPPIPGTTNNGLPLVDGGTTVYNTFGQGFYSLTPLNGLASTSYNAQAVGLPFFNYYTSTRILARPNSSSNWVANGTHQAGVAGTGPAKRINMTMLPADLTLADTANCTAPVTAPFTGPRSVCTNSTQTYSVTNTGNTFLWIVQGGTQMSGGNTNSITVKWGSTGTTGVLIVIEQGACGSGIPAYDFVTISPTTVSSITGKSYAPENTTAGNEETYSIDPQPGYTYSWSISGGTIITGAATETITVRWGPAGAGQVSASITNGCGTSTIVKPVNIYVVINSIKSGAWNDPATWDCNCIPASYNSVRVRNPHVVTFPNSDLVINNLIADIGGTFNNTSNKTLTVNGDLLIDGTYTGTSELILNGTGNIDGVGTISTTANLTLTGGDKTIMNSCVLVRTSGDIYIKSGVNAINNGVFTTTRNIVGETSSATWTNMESSVLNIWGTFLATGTAVVNTVPNTVEYRGSASQTIKQTNYYNLYSTGTGARVLPSSGIVGVAGDFLPGTNTFTITGSTVNFNGTDQQIGAFTFNNLTISGGGTKTLTGNVTYNSALNLTNGIIATSTNTLTGASTSSVTRTSGHINGNFQKWIPSTAAVTFEVGTATDYTPLTTAFASITTAGYITASAIAGDHPSISSTCLDAAKSVNVYYSLTNNSLTAGTSTLTFNYLTGDVDAAATPSKFNVEVYNGTTWSAPLTLIGVPSSTQTVVSGVATFGTYEIAEGGLVITSHPGSSSVCTGNNASFTVATNGVSPTFQWQVNSSGTWSDISNGGVYSTATTASLTITNPPVGMNGYQYRCKVTGTQCTGVTIISNAATLTVTAAPTAVAGTAVATCSNPGTVNITAGSSSINNTGTTWTSNGSGVFANANSLSTATYTPSGADISAGSVILTLTATGGGACATVTSNKILTITAAPTAVAGTAVTACANIGAVNITAGSSSTNNNGITWTSNGTGTFVNPTSLSLATYTPSTADNSAGSVTLTLTATGVGTCAAVTSTKTFTINTGCAITWSGGTSTDWNTASNWNIGAIPASTNNVVVPSGTTYSPVITGAVVNVKSITVNASATLAITPTGELDVYGDLLNNGTFTTVLGSTVAFKGSAAQNITGVPVMYNAVINNTGGVTLQSALAVNGTLSLTKGILTTNSNLTINFDNGGNIGYASGDLGSISGTVTGKRNLVAKTHYIGTPFSGVTSAQVQATTPLYLNSYWKMYTRTFATQNWFAVTDVTTAMPIGTGFSLALPAAAPLVFTGTYDHTFSFTSPSYANTATGKYLFIANPYPSVLDWDNGAGWTKNNIDNAIYYWDAPNNRVASYVLGAGTNGATRYIPAMQAVLVSLTGSGGNASISINNNARNMMQTSAYFRQGADEIIRIKIEDSSTMNNDETLVRFNEAATSAFDSDLDAYKLLNGGSTPSIYTTEGIVHYSINSYASPDSAKFIPIAVKIPADGKYTVTVANDNPNLDYVLVDKQLGIEQSITNSYTFTGLKTDDINRFELQLRTSTTTGTQTANKAGGMEINSATHGGFYIQTQRYAGSEAEIEIMDITGNSLAKMPGKKLAAGTTFIPLEYTDGAYLVKVYVDSATFAGMIVLVK